MHPYSLPLLAPWWVLKVVVRLVWFQAGGVIPLTTLLEVTRKLVDEGYQYISNENRSPFNTKYAIVEEWIHPIKGSASVVQE